jgi:hypothetical protein
VLVTFFKKSRDQWKRKCLAAKARLKKSANLAAWLRTSRDEWKAEAQRLAVELQTLREEQKTRLV